MDPLTQMGYKYHQHFFNPLDFPAKATKVVYFPSYDGMIRTYYERRYLLDEFEPGDILTIKQVVKEYEHCNLVYVEETKHLFSPAELIALEHVEKNDIQLINQQFRYYRGANPL